jgi:hypothetical protein
MSGFRRETGCGSAPLANMNVDVEIDFADAGLRRAMRAALVPAAIAGARIPDIGKFQASPLRQLAAAFAAELPGQYDFLAALVGADDVWTQFACATTIAAHHLLPGEDGVAKEGVGGVGHGVVASRDCRKSPDRFAGASS